MGQIKFSSSGYWDTKTMQEGEKASDENLKIVQDFCQELTAKYAWDKGCIRHPEQIQWIDVYFTNGVKELSVDKPNTCLCHDMLVRLQEIADFEMGGNNPRV